MNYDVIIPTIKDYLLGLQTKICLYLEHEDLQQKFLIDDWLRAEGGGGKTCVLSEGRVIERGAVNFSHVFGETLPASASQRHPSLATTAFQATGISLIIHPPQSLCSYCIEFAFYCGLRNRFTTGTVVVWWWF